MENNKIMVVTTHPYEDTHIEYVGAPITDEQIVRVLEKMVYSVPEADRDEWIEIVLGKQHGFPTIHIWVDGKVVEKETRRLELTELSFPVKTSYYEPRVIKDARVTLKRLKKERRQAMKNGASGEVLYELSKPIDRLKQNIEDFEAAKKKPEVNQSEQ